MECRRSLRPRAPLPVLAPAAPLALPPGGDPGVRIPPRQASTSPTRDGQAQLVVHPNR